MNFNRLVLLMLLRVLEIAAQGSPFHDSLNHSHPPHGPPFHGPPGNDIISLDNPSYIERFPSCGIECIIETQETSPCAFRNLTCECSPPFRSSAAACQSITCSPSNYGKTQLLTNLVCAPLYIDGTISPTAVSAAIAAATSAAASALATADPANPLTYPSCARNCIKQALQADCGDFNNTKCICQSPVFFANITPCEVSTCTPADLQTTLYLSEANCNKTGIGGIGDREAQLAAFNATLGGGAGGNLSAFFDQLMQESNANENRNVDLTRKATAITGGAIQAAKQWEQVAIYLLGLLWAVIVLVVS
ncbi:MAG: hypothetical protein Q9202_001915 [Teloschistes flavicans]